MTSTRAEIQDALVPICRDFTERMHATSAAAGVQPRFDEPYLPHFVGETPRILVLAEAQNLSDTNGRYVTNLEKAAAADRHNLFHRLDPTRDYDAGQIGIQPWDDGVLQIGLMAAVPGVNLNEVAVSNAVVWSFVNVRANARPFGAKLNSLAVDFWKAVFKVWSPDLIVAAGRVAQKVVQKAAPGRRMIGLALPSPRLAAAEAMFHTADLLARYPEVQALMDTPEVQAILEKAVGDKAKLEQRLVFHACHAVSRRSRPTNRAPELDVE